MRLGAGYVDQTLNLNNQQPGPWIRAQDTPLLALIELEHLSEFTCSTVVKSCRP